MLNYKFLLKNIDFVHKKLTLKKFKLNINLIHKFENNKKIILNKLNKLFIKRKKISKLINFFLKKKKEKKNLKLKAIKIKKKLLLYKKKINKLNLKKKKYLNKIPNLPNEDIPTNNNLDILYWGKFKKFNFKIKNYFDLFNNNKYINYKTSVKLVGSRFFIIKNNIAKLYRILSQFMLDIHVNKHGYEEYYTPYISNYKSLYCTGHLPKFKKDIFFVTSMNNNNKYYLIPTAEVPLSNIYRNEIINEDDLPIKLVSHTPCFRFECGSYGKYNKGLLRTKQFDKVEIVQFVNPKNSMKSLEEITLHAEKILKLLNLPYRKIILSSYNTSFSSCKTYDLEVWIPSINKYIEVSSCSNTSDFQSRRLNTKFYNKKYKKKYFVHILNASALSINRVLISILENYQLSDGRIKIPNVLIPYMKTNYI